MVERVLAKITIGIELSCKIVGDCRDMRREVGWSLAITSVSLVDAGLARMSRDETELVIGPLEGCRDGHGLGDHGLGQLLASLDRNG